jgi:hypothetical protein
MSPDILSPPIRGSLEAVQRTAQELGARLLRDMDVHVQQLRRAYGDETVERYLHSMGGQRLLCDVEKALRCIYVPPVTSPHAPGVLRSEGGGALYEWEAEVEMMAQEHACATFMAPGEEVAA